MDMIWFYLVLMTIFNTAMCILLPRLLTMNWLEAIAAYLGETKERQAIENQVARENIAQS
ncbi:hypothetical protein [Oscillatoria salina]|uniref:hypothetical protein n=1 Tax=Oscillatoria salina TaxID=331517 RepID=UPI0013B84672|nr:hypothetical protein [Oscillatoria salina]MBZ8182084.1 hypothetical protein [Oscillatoria salina IIICB1]NET89496.1 hypothetical protein [Kamptonema sp. SIO1D9]